MATSKLPKQSEDFPAWYQEVVKQADLAEPGPAKGSMIIKPYGYAIWEHVQRELDDQIKSTGHQNFYFPALMPYTLLEQEAEHVEGFAPEVYTVTKAGNEEIGEPLALRPTSEAVIWDTYAKWIQSYRDLPLLYNQWANVWRAEMRTRLFLRTSEFLWQEGHTAHETAKEAREEARRMLDVYVNVSEHLLGISVLQGRKSDSERFPGADDSLTIEALMRDGKALQAGTSHDLGQNFAKTYGVQFVARDGKQEYAYATSWGMSTRIIGGLIMAHGDDQGLRLPPAVAPYQIVIVPISKGDTADSAVTKAVDEIVKSLKSQDIRVHVDNRDTVRPGFKFNEWELKGVPLRLEIGSNEASGTAVPGFRRDTNEKVSLQAAGIGQQAKKLLEEIQHGFLQQSTIDRQERTHIATSYEQLISLLLDRAGFVLTGWCGSKQCEAKVKKDAKATTRCLPFDTELPKHCVICGQDAKHAAAWAQAY